MHHSSGLSLMKRCGIASGSYSPIKRSIPEPLSTGCIMRSLIARRLGPRQQFPAETAFDGLPIVDGVVQKIGAPALADDPAPHLGSEPYGLLAHRISSSGVGTHEADYIGVPQRLELSGRHGDRLPRLRLHRLIPGLGRA